MIACPHVLHVPGYSALQNVYAREGTREEIRAALAALGEPASAPSIPSALRPRNVPPYGRTWSGWDTCNVSNAGRWARGDELVSRRACRSQEHPKRECWPGYEGAYWEALGYKEFEKLQQALAAWRQDGRVARAEERTAKARLVEIAKRRREGESLRSIASTMGLTLGKVQRALAATV
jgi:hypothetical protein